MKNENNQMTMEKDIESYADLRRFQREHGSIEMGEPRDLKAEPFTVAYDGLASVVHPDLPETGGPGYFDDEDEVGGYFDDDDSGAPDYGAPDYGSPSAYEEVGYVTEDGEWVDANDVLSANEMASGGPDEIEFEDVVHDETGAPRKKTKKARKVRRASTRRKRKSRSPSFTRAAVKTIGSSATRAPSRSGMPFASVYNADLQSSPVAADAVVPAELLKQFLYSAYGFGPALPVNDVAAESSGSATATLVPADGSVDDGVLIRVPLILADIAAAILYQTPSTVVTLTITYYHAGLNTEEMAGFQLMPRDANKAARLCVIPFRSVQSIPCPCMALMGQDVDNTSSSPTAYDLSITVAASGMPSNSQLSATAITTEHAYYKKLIAQSFDRAIFEHLGGGKLR